MMDFVFCMLFLVFCMLFFIFCMLFLVFCMLSSSNTLLVCIEKGGFSSLVLLQSRFRVCFYY